MEDKYDNVVAVWGWNDVPFHQDFDNYNVKSFPCDFITVGDRDKPAMKYFTELVAEMIRDDFVFMPMSKSRDPNPQFYTILTLLAKDVNVYKNGLQYLQTQYRYVGVWLQKRGKPRFQGMKVYY